jgi:hypothetical protein
MCVRMKKGGLWISDYCLSFVSFLPCFCFAFLRLVPSSLIGQCIQVCGDGICNRTGICM